MCCIRVDERKFDTSVGEDVSLHASMHTRN